MKRPSTRAHLLRSQRGRAVLQVRPFGFDLLAEDLGRARLHQDLDARLVDVVAPAVAVVDAQDRFEVGEQVRPRQELADHVADDGRAPHAAADDHAEADLARVRRAPPAARCRAGRSPRGPRSAPFTAILNLRGR